MTIITDTFDLGCNFVFSCKTRSVDVFEHVRKLGAEIVDFELPKELYFREKYLKRLRYFYNDTEILKVISGVRNCGKNSIMQMVIKELLDSGIPQENILYFLANMDRGESEESEMEHRVLYHGSCAEMPNPELSTCGFYKDFGYGFYCANIEKQTKRWSMKRQLRR